MHLAYVTLPTGNRQTTRTPHSQGVHINIIYLLFPCSQVACPFLRHWLNSHENAPPKMHQLTPSPTPSVMLLPPIHVRFERLPKSVRLQRLLQRYVNSARRLFEFGERKWDGSRVSFNTIYGAEKKGKLRAMPCAYMYPNFS